MQAKTIVLQSRLFNSLLPKATFDYAGMIRQHSAID